MNNKYVSLLSLLVLPLFFIAISCSASNTAAPASPNAASTSSPSQPEAPLINLPSSDKTKVPVIQFSAAPASIAPGATSVLSWNVTNATTVTIDHGIGTVSATGTKNVSLTAPATYKLTAVNSEGSAIKTVSISVTQAAAPATKSPSK
jgi:PKD repeat protein